MKDLVGTGRCRSVRTFRQDLAFDTVRILRSDLIFRRTRGKYITLDLEKVFVPDMFDVRIILELPVLLQIIENRRDIQTVTIVDRSADVRDRDDLIALLMHQLSTDAANVARTLHDDRCLLRG